MATATINPANHRLRAKSNHLMPRTKMETQPVGRMATEEELALFREAEEERAKGHYYAQRDDETVDEFIDRMLLGKSPVGIASK